jgi:hypothetical protein
MLQPKKPKAKKNSTSTAKKGLVPKVKNGKLKLIYGSSFDTEVGSHLGPNSLKNH